MSDVRVLSSQNDDVELIYEALDEMEQGFIVHANGEILYSNKKLIELLEIPPELVSKGAPLEDFIQFGITRGDEKYAPETEILNQATAKNIHEDGEFLERTTPSGKIIQVAIKPGKNAKRVTTYTDVTKDRVRERELAEAMSTAEGAERAKSEFLANMSHEIRTPMNGVMGMAELLAATDLDVKQKMFADIILKSGASLLTIINDILDFSKIDAGQMELNPAPFNLAEAIEDVAALVSAKVAEKDLELIVRVDPALPQMLVGDVGRIRQVVTNLLGNAVKFTETGHIFINIEGSVRKGDNADIVNLKISIKDTGIGIPRDKCSEVFRKFNQADTSATRKHEGTGLGLSISSSLVKLMGGEIDVESDIGKGSTFWFTTELPVHGETERKETVPVDITGSRVLVIDDNEVNRFILSEQLTAWKFDNAAASSGDEGLDVMRAVIGNGMQLDLVILDYQMPDLNGAEVLEIMRSDEALKNIPVVMLTSVDSIQVNQRLIKLGAEVNLTKPTRSSLLRDTIFHVIGNNLADTKAGRNNKPDVQPLTDKKTMPVEIMSNIPIPATDDKQLDILVAEDNEVNQIVMRQILEDTGLYFEIVEDGRLAIESHYARKPRIILMDVSMPIMNGRDATIEIRKHEIANNLRHTPIIGVTAHALKGDLEACLDAGMDDYLSKPISPNQLLKKIEHWLQSNSEQKRHGN